MQMASESEGYRKHIENLEMVGVRNFDFIHPLTQDSMGPITKIP